MHLEWEMRSDVPADKARAWYFDLDENDHTAPEFVEAWGPPDPRESRSVLSRTPDTLEVEDVAMKGKMTLRSTVRLEGDDRLTVRGGGKMFDTDIEMVFAPIGKSKGEGKGKAKGQGKGSHITIVGAFRPKGLMRLMMPLMRGKLANKLGEDVRLHQAQMEREWKEDPW